MFSSGYIENHPEVPFIAVSDQMSQINDNDAINAEGSHIIYNTIICSDLFAVLDNLSRREVRVQTLMCDTVSIVL